MFCALADVLQIRGLHWLDEYGLHTFISISSSIGTAHLATPGCRSTSCLWELQDAWVSGSHRYSRPVRSWRCNKPSKTLSSVLEKARHSLKFFSSSVSTPVSLQSSHTESSLLVARGWLLQRSPIFVLGLFLKIINIVGRMCGRSKSKGLLSIVIYWA